VDIAPTVLELAGVSVEPEAPFEGESFAGAVLDSTHTHRRFAVSGSYVHTQESAGGGALREGVDFVADGSLVPPKSTTPFVATDRWGYTPVGSHGEPELFDLRTDPLAERSIAAGNEMVIGELREHLLDHLARHGASDSLIALWGR
jgi:hypothetical protein